MIAVAKVLKPNGIRGEVVVLPLSVIDERYASPMHIWVGTSDHEAVEKELLSIRREGKKNIAVIAGMGTMNEAELLRGMFFFVDDAERVQPLDGSYFVDDLIGCDVVDIRLGCLGKIIDILVLPANDVWVVQNEIEKRDVWVPAVKAFIQSVDMKNRRVMMDLPEGLLE